MSQPLTLKISEWDTNSIKYMPPRVSDRGAKSVNMISSQTNRSLHLTTPLMMTWGISDYVDEQGVSDGRFTMTLNFPGEGYETPDCTEFLDKLKDFENKILDDAVKHSDLWFGEEMSREVAKHTFFPFIKYPKDKNTKKIDYSKAPSIRAKVPNYSGKWSVELYDAQGSNIYPCDNENVTPVDMVPKKSMTACVLQCGGLWFGGKGWGLTWRLVQAVVKPPKVASIFGKCHIQLSAEETQMISDQVLSDVPEASDDYPVGEPPKLARQDTVVLNETEVEDSDEEDTAPKVSPKVEVDEAPKKKRVVKKKKVASA